MPVEYLIYIIFPFILGLLREKYKDISTKNYAIFVFFVLVFIHIYTTLMHKPYCWKLDGFLWSVSIGCFILCTGIFHLQKVGRKIQKDRQKNKLKINNK